MDKIKIYAKSILIPLIVGGIVGWIMSSFIDYDTLIKPVLSPPSIVFPIAWTILYILMGVSYGILKSHNLIDKEANMIYYLQLIFNAFWSIIFFVFKSRLFAFFWIIALLIFVGYMIVLFFRKNKIAGLLQIPYFIWLLFASYLNIAIYLLNG